MIHQVVVIGPRKPVGFHVSNYCRYCPMFTTHRIHVYGRFTYLPVISMEHESKYILYTVHGSYEKPLVMIDVLLKFASYNIEQENLFCKWGLVMLMFTETTSRCSWIFANISTKLHTDIQGWLSNTMEFEPKKIEENPSSSHNLWTNWWA